MKRIALLVSIVVVLSGPARAQIWYDGTGNQHDDYRGIVTPNPVFSPPQPLDWSMQLPVAPTVRSYIPAPVPQYGSLPCTMPGCR